MRVAPITIGVLASLALAAYPPALAGWSTALLLLGALGILFTWASLASRRASLAATAASVFAIEYAVALIVGGVPVDLSAPLLGLLWLVHLESVEWASLRRNRTEIDSGVLFKRRRFLLVELGTGGLAAGLALAAAVAVGDRGDPILFTLGVGAALLAASLVITIGRRSVSS